MSSSITRTGNPVLFGPEAAGRIRTHEPDRAL